MSISIQKWVTEHFFTTTFNYIATSLIEPCRNFHSLQN